MSGAPAFLFAHGAGASSASPWMRAWAARLGRIGPVETFDYPYMRERRKLPDRLPRLVEAHRAALAAARERHAGARLFLIGKSLGSRVGCHLSLAEPEPPAGVICLGYPLRGAGKSAKLRDEVLVAMTAPVLFVQGTRDPLCPLDLLVSARARMRAPSEVHVVEGGDHSLELQVRWARAAGTSQEESDQRALATISAFVGK